MPSGEHPGFHINSMTEHRTLPFVEVYLVGGALYLDLMHHFVELFREDGFVTGSAPVTEICGPFGIMRKRMAIWLNKPQGDSGEAGGRSDR